MDLARSPAGNWWVIADRTQAPSGMGYTLQNRLVSARTLPDVFDRSKVRQLARFYDIKRDSLLALAGDQRSNPTVVLLTPGPGAETYFEHSFLAGQWNFTLVEGADLTVLDRRVYLKTLAGLKPVDVILRRVDDSFCDLSNCAETLCWECLGWLKPSQRFGCHRQCAGQRHGRNVRADGISAGSLPAPSG